MRILFAAYRDWAVRLLPAFERHPRVSHVKHVRSHAELELELVGRHAGFAMTPHQYDLVTLCGWSWQVSQQAVNVATIVSEHPACSDRYSPGTPLQNQILDGLKRTKHRIVKVGYPELGERLYSPSHEVDMNLTGNMDDILSEMESTARTIYTRFLDDYPNITWVQWAKDDSGVPRRGPDDSVMTRHDLATLPVDKLYDRIRMLESPYPNARLEDETGTLYFERVGFKSKR